MQSLLIDIYRSLNTVYSGWILWNLFLAFIPLLMSFVLFRPKALSAKLLILACFVVGVIGGLGVRLRTPWLIRIWLRKADAAISTDILTWFYLLWIAIVCLITIGGIIWLTKRVRTVHSALWWLGFAVFTAFLPNAPYVLTDIIHLIRGTSSGLIPTWVVALVFIPLHVIAILVAFEAYVIALLNLDYHLKKLRKKRFIIPTEILFHFLSALGIYLGRFMRFNSWDLVVDPTNVVANTLNTLTSKRPLAVIFVTFVILTLLYWIAKQITLGLKLRLRYAQQGIDVLD